MLDKLTKAACEELLNQSFTLHINATRTMMVRLVKVTGWGPQAGVSGQREPFTLEFRGPPEMPMLPQHMYPIELGSWGPLDIFIVPIGKDAEGVRYEAIFS